MEALNEMLDLFIIVGISTLVPLYVIVTPIVFVLGVFR